MECDQMGLCALQSALATVELDKFEVASASKALKTARLYLAFLEDKEPRNQLAGE